MSIQFCFTYSLGGVTVIRRRLHARLCHTTHSDVVFIWSTRNIFERNIARVIVCYRAVWLTSYKWYKPQLRFAWPRSRANARWARLLVRPRRHDTPKKLFYWQIRAFAIIILEVTWYNLSAVIAISLLYLASGGNMVRWTYRPTVRHQLIILPQIPRWLQQYGILWLVTL